MKSLLADNLIKHYAKARIGFLNTFFKLKDKMLFAFIFLTGFKSLIENIKKSKCRIRSSPLPYKDTKTH